MVSVSTPSAFDLKTVVTGRRLSGLWRMLRGYRLAYSGALFSLGIAAVSKTLTYLLLAYLIDDVLGRGIFDQTLLWIGLGFIGLALIEGLFTFISGRLAARSSRRDRPPPARLPVRSHSAPVICLSR